MKKEIVIFQNKSGAIEFRGDFDSETLWASQAQIADLFVVERSVVTKHIRNILKNKELDKDSVCAKFAHTASDGKTYMVQNYSLDVVLAVGYRTNSKIAIEFRKWATKTFMSKLNLDICRIEILSVISFLFIFLKTTIQYLYLSSRKFVCRIIRYLGINYINNDLDPTSPGLCKQSRGAG